MKLIHKAVRWENSRGALELRFYYNAQPGDQQVSAHWKACDGRTHQNTPYIVKDDIFNSDALDSVLSRVGRRHEDLEDLRDECIRIIGKELDVEIPPMTPAGRKFSPRQRVTQNGG
tara:strand:- start:1804 stop:2151 length:348 start_codon:yes stop_codon:yes gene_type:complete